MRSLLKCVLDAIFPPNCILCRHYNPQNHISPLCPECFQKLKFNQPPFCIQCSRHLKIRNPEAICPSCQKHPLSFDQAIGLLQYQGTVQTLLHHFKFHHKTSLRHCFRMVLKHFLTQYPFSFHPESIIIPIPIHPVRLRERGFHQTLILAQAFAEVLSFPILNNVLMSQSYASHQTGLSQKERFTNIQGAFTIKNSSNIKNRYIILIDDLLTTGATLNEASQMLKSNGAKHITILTLALT